MSFDVFNSFLANPWKQVSKSQKAHLSHTCSVWLKKCLCLSHWGLFQEGGRCLLSERLNQNWKFNRNWERSCLESMVFCEKYTKNLVWPSLSVLALDFSYLPNLFVGFLLKSILNKLCASGDKNWGIPSLALLWHEWHGNMLKSCVSNLFLTFKTNFVSSDLLQWNLNN